MSSQEAVGAADDCLEIEVYRDLPGRRLLLESFRDPAPPPDALLASALHALGPDDSLQGATDEAPVLFECEGCGLRFRDCAAAVCHERLCLPAASASTGPHNKPQSKREECDALQWLLHAAEASGEDPADYLGPGISSSPDSGAPSSEVHNGPLVTTDPTREGLYSCQASSEDLHSLEGPHGRAGPRLGRRFLERLSLGDKVSWERGPRFFPRQGEGAPEAAERALAFACKHNAGSSYAEADWNNPEDVAAISRYIGSPTELRPAACDTTGRPTKQS